MFVLGVEQAHVLFFNIKERVVCSELDQYMYCTCTVLVPNWLVFVLNLVSTYFIFIFIYLEALIEQYITNIEQKYKKRDVFDKGLANGRGVPTRQTPY